MWVVVELPAVGLEGRTNERERRRGGGELPVLGSGPGVGTWSYFVYLTVRLASLSVEGATSDSGVLGAHVTFHDSPPQLCGCGQSLNTIGRQAARKASTSSFISLICFSP